MKATEKTRQKLSYTQDRTTAKGRSKRWKVDMNSLKDYIEYMEEDFN